MSRVWACTNQNISHALPRTSSTIYSGTPRRPPVMLPAACLEVQEVQEHKSMSLRNLWLWKKPLPYLTAALQLPLPVSSFPSLRKTASRVRKAFENCQIQYLLPRLGTQMEWSHLTHQFLVASQNRASHMSEPLQGIESNRPFEAEHLFPNFATLPLDFWLTNGHWKNASCAA